MSALAQLARDDLDLVAQKSILDTLIPITFPDLQSMQFMGVIAWNKRIHANSVYWHPRVLDKERLKLFIDGPVPGLVQDVDDCITAAFMPGEIDAKVLAQRGLS